MMNHSFINTQLNRKTLFSYLLFPFSLIFAFITFTRRLLYQKIPHLSYKSKLKIISVGNITTGGSGKTPYILYLAKNLCQKHKIAIILRGYKGSFENTTTLLCDYEKVYDNINEAGDEAILYASNLTGVPICVGKNRVKSIKLLENKFHDLEIVLLDDAFQYLKILQDVKICIFNAVNPFSNGFCLPAGLLRESLNSLKNADFFVINGDKNLLKKEVVERLEKYNKPILYGDYAISSIHDLKKTEISIKDLFDKNCVLLSGIGSPSSFENTIIKAGLSFHKHIKLPDHFHYTQDFLDNIKNEKFYYILTTEKDYSKIKSLKTNMPIAVICIEFRMEGEISPPPFMEGEISPPPFMEGEISPPPFMEGGGGRSDDVYNET